MDAEKLLNLLANNLSKSTNRYQICPNLNSQFWRMACSIQVHWIVLNHCMQQIKLFVIWRDICELIHLGELIGLESHLKYHMKSWYTSYPVFYFSFFLPQHSHSPCFSNCTLILVAVLPIMLPTVAEICDSSSANQSSSFPGLQLLD